LSKKKREGIQTTKRKPQTGEGGKVLGDIRGFSLVGRPGAEEGIRKLYRQNAFVSGSLRESGGVGGGKGERAALPKCLSLHHGNRLVIQKEVTKSRRSHQPDGEVLQGHGPGGREGRRTSKREGEGKRENLVSHPSGRGVGMHLVGG